jgi:hypothetical protein
VGCIYSVRQAERQNVGRPQAAERRAQGQARRRNGADREQ